MEVLPGVAGEGMSGRMTPKWICLQIGAREHYAIPRMLARRGRLGALVTDAWVPPGSAAGLLGRPLRERFHADLASSRVRAWTAGLAWLEFVSRVRGRSGWPLVLARNEWFQRRAAGFLSRLQVEGGGPAIVFGYSYAAMGPFRVAKQRGWRTVLGQIDPGPPEAKIVADLSRRYPEWACRWEEGPAEYWAAWREECRLADLVMVNSEWSREALVGEGVPEEKLILVPLAYDAPREAAEETRRYPEAFSRTRPLRVLYLGQVVVRKGIHDLVAAARSLVGQPVEFDVVGGHGSLPASLPKNLAFRGPVPRSEASRCYQHADLFVLPTHSDGFALTQLEAMAHGLPVIATRRCGAVVEHGRSGWIVEHGNPEQLANVVREALSEPARLSEIGAAAATRIEDFSLDRLSGDLLRLESILFSSPAHGLSSV